MPSWATLSRARSQAVKMMMKPSSSGTGGLSLSDIALGHTMLKKAHALGIGQELRYR
ncbi:Uncharacterised protein [Citrobacter koseri]|nr:Uncharacterised protein [Citrobacter koseri]